MGLKATLLRPFAHRIAKNIRKSASQAPADQRKLFEELIKVGKGTRFGKDHRFDLINNYDDFKKSVPIREYEGLRPYIDRIIMGEKDVLWTGAPLYFAKTSGTTSGAKYIPITKESVPNHVLSARNALFNYFSSTGNGAFFEGKMIFLSGSPRLEKKGNISMGRLSGIINHWVPNWLKPNQLPSYKVNCIDDWEKKVEHIVSETKDEDLRLISGIPPWVQMYYEQLLKATGKNTIKELFPNFSLFVYGGVNFEPYRQRLEQMTGSGIDTLETYPASEGFIAFQDKFPHEGLLMMTDSGIFFEFVPIDQIYKDQPERFMIGQVKIGVNYAIIINSNAGLWGYNIGDTVEFVSKNPFRVKVTGRIKHFISAFGEHVIGKEVEEAITFAMQDQPCKIAEFTVAPMIKVKHGTLPYHEWLIEFVEMPSDLNRFATVLDKSMQDQNIYYKDLVAGKILRPLIISIIEPDGFKKYMKKVGKLGGQNKVARLSDNRIIADQLVVLQTKTVP